MASKGRKHAIPPKESFATLLKSLVNKWNYGTGAANVISGLWKRGLVPFYHDEVITQLPTSNNALLLRSIGLDHSLVKMLTEMRGNNSNTSKAAPKKRLAVEAGKFYSVISDSENVETELSDESSHSDSDEKKSESSSKKSDESIDSITELYNPATFTVSNYLPEIQTESYVFVLLQWNETHITLLEWLVWLLIKFQ